MSVTSKTKTNLPTNILRHSISKNNYRLKETSIELTKKSVCKQPMFDKRTMSMHEVEHLCMTATQLVMAVTQLGGKYLSLPDCNHL